MLTILSSMVKMSLALSFF